MLPIGARTVFRALRTRAAAQIGPDWVWPYWLENQLDPDVARLRSPRPPAVPHQRDRPQLDRDRQRRLDVGGDRRPPRARHHVVRRMVARLVDRRRRPLVPARRGSSRRACASDWSGAVAGGRDGDAHPGRRRGASRVRGRRRGRAGRSSRSRTARRCRSRSPSPCGPTTPKVSRSSSASSCTTAPPSPSTAGSRCCCPEAAGARGGLDVPRRRQRGGGAGAATAGPSRFPTRLRDDAGLAQAAFIYPLPHTATLRVALPMVASKRRTRRRGLARRRVERAASYPAVDPAAGQRRGRGWAAQSSGACGSMLPDERLQEAVDANRRFLLVLHDGAEHHARAEHVPPVLVPRRRVPARRARPLRVPRARRPRCCASYPEPPASRRVLPQPAPRVGRQRLRAVGHGRALAAHPRSRAARRRSSARRQGRALDRPQARVEAAPRRPSSTACCRRASRPSTSVRSTTSTGTTSGAWPGLLAAPSCCAAAGDDAAAEEADGVGRRASGPTSKASLGIVADRLGTDAIPAGPAPAARRRRDRFAGRVRPARLCWPPTIPRVRGDRSTSSASGSRLGDAFYQSDQPHRPRHVPHDAGRRGRAGRRRPARPRPAAVAARRGHADVDVAGGDPPAAARRLHGRRSPRLGGGRLPVVRAQPAGARDRRDAGPRAVLDDSRRLVGARRRGARRARRTSAGCRTRCAGTATARRCCGSANVPGIAAAPCPGLDPSWSTTEPAGERPPLPTGNGCPFRSANRRLSSVRRRGDGATRGKGGDGQHPLDQIPWGSAGGRRGGRRGW